MEVDEERPPRAGPSSSSSSGLEHPTSGYRADDIPMQERSTSYSNSRQDVFKKPAIPCSAILSDDELSCIQDMLSPPLRPSIPGTSATSATHTIRKLLNHIQATQNSVKSDRKGKGRATDQQLSAASSVGLAVSNMFEQGEIAKLQVENDMLRKQAAVLARKGNVLDAATNRGSAQTEEALQRRIRSLQTDKQYLIGRLHESETRTRRFELELRYLRSFLLQRVQPVYQETESHKFEQSDAEPLEQENRGSAVAEEEDESGMQLDQAPVSEGDINDAATLVLDSSQGSRKARRPSSSVEPTLPMPGDSVEIPAHTRGTKRKRSEADDGPLEASKSRPRLASRLRRATMADAETEHLLLASARLTRLAKFIDYHPHSHVSLLPDAQQLSSSSRTQAILLPPLPEPLPAQPGPAKPSPLLEEAIRLPSMRRRASSTAAPRYRERSLSASSAGSESRHLDADFQDPGKEETAEGTSTGPTKKIGRPRGSPNKTKTVSIHWTQAVLRRAKAQEYADSHGGQGRGRGRPSESRHPEVSEVEEIPEIASTPLDNNLDPRLGTPRQIEANTTAERAATVFGSGGNGNVADLLQAARKLDYTKPQGATDSSLGRPNPDTPSKPQSPAGNGAAGDEDDYYYEDEEEEEEEAAGSVQQHASTSKLPGSQSNGIERTSRSGSVSGSVPRQVSALDLLADQAAATSGPSASGQSSNNDIAPQQHHYSFSILDSLDPRPSINPPISSSNWFATMMQPSPVDTSAQPPLAPAFTPFPIDHTAQPNFPDASASTEWSLFTRNLPPMTIAEQLRQGVDPAHHLIDPKDIKKGMTPAAALAKKARSPYVKWSVEEDEMLITSVSEHGTRWDAVAAKLPNRSYHQCRQRWLRGLKSGDALPQSMRYLKPKIDRAIASHEATKVGRKSGGHGGGDASDYEE